MRIKVLYLPKNFIPPKQISGYAPVIVTNADLFTQHSMYGHNQSADHGHHRIDSKCFHC